MFGHERVIRGKKFLEGECEPRKKTTIQACSRMHQKGKKGRKGGLEEGISHKQFRSLEHKEHASFSSWMKEKNALAEEKVALSQIFRRPESEREEFSEERQLQRFWVRTKK